MILMLGDVHGNFDHLVPAINAEKPAAIILLGDIEAQQSFELEIAEAIQLTEVYWIPGNHDTDSKANYENLYNSKLADKNLHGKITLIDGLRVAGLGGVFRESIWYPRYSAEIVPKFKNHDVYVKTELEAELWKEYRRFSKLNQIPNGLPSPSLNGKALKHKSSIFYDDWLALYGQEADILVTHEAPSCHPNGFIALDVLAQSMKVKYSFHGHHHDRLNYSAYDEKFGFSAHGIGFCGVTDQYGGMVSAGDFDEQRMHRQYREK